MTNMNITKNMTDEAILEEIGRRLARRRIELDLTQAALAGQAGVAKRTLERVEAGATAQFSTIIRLFRALDLVSALDQVLPQARPGPIEIMARKGKMRRRASSAKTASEPDETWTWSDDA